MLSVSPRLPVSAPLTSVPAAVYSSSCRSSIAPSAAGWAARLMGPARVLNETTSRSPTVSMVPEPLTDLPETDRGSPPANSLEWSSAR